MDLRKTQTENKRQTPSSLDRLQKNRLFALMKDMFWTVKRTTGFRQGPIYFLVPTKH